ncbi:MAG: hypothetical protein LQ346_001707 [Caloplaca aetnensis]|nr:MAG: hypothetical protein LQ346_001707 [Caloplaca aetnensis]
MFAVPGWSVSATKLKVQHESDPVGAPSTPNGNDKSAKEESRSKKRKRGNGKVNSANVMNENLAELWERHIEGKSAAPTNGGDEKPEKRKKKRRRNSKGAEHNDLGHRVGQVDAQGENPLVRTSTSKNCGANEVAHPAMAFPPPAQDGNAKKEQRKSKAQQKGQLRESGDLVSPRRPISTSTKSPDTSRRPTQSQPATTSPIISSIPALPPFPPKHVKLTPLQTAMRAKLISARFRHINETLYTTPSTQASSLFSSNPEAFASYHTGFRAQVASWPQNPVEIFVQEIKERGAVAGPKSQKQLFKDQKKKGGKKGKGKPAAAVVTNVGVKLDPLPRSGAAKACTILDLGCGDGSLQASLLPHTSSLNLDLHSFDLSRGDTRNANLITVCDIAHLPLEDDSADIAIFCLALMGTNWTDFVREAARVVRVGGECWVGEVRSRFMGAKEIEKATATKKSEVEKRKKKKGTDVEEDMANGKIEVEEDEVAGKKTKQQETDVGPFIDVFRRRGFALRGDVDLGNKMFVRMWFVRVAPNAASIRGRRGQQQSPNFIDREDETVIGPEEEAKVLKPCLYKTR